MSCKKTQKSSSMSSRIKSMNRRNLFDMLPKRSKLNKEPNRNSGAEELNK